MSAVDYAVEMVDNGTTFSPMISLGVRVKWSGEITAPGRVDTFDTTHFLNSRRENAYLFTQVGLPGRQERSR